MQKDIQVVILVIGGTVLFLLLVGIVIVSLLFYQKAQNKHTKRFQELENSYQQEVLKAQLEVKETTLNAISREIHDNIGQVLSLAKLNLNFISTSAESSEMEKVNNTKALIGKAIQDLRSLSKAMNAEYIMDRTIDALVNDEVEALQKTGQFIADFNVEGQAYKVEPKKHLILFRMVQELISNIIKHAQATSITISLDYNPGALEIKVADNGIGFDYENVNPEHGTGIKNILFRANLINALVTFESKSDSGTVVTISLPKD